MPVQQNWGGPQKHKGWPMCCEPPIKHNSDVEVDQHKGWPTKLWATHLMHSDEKRDQLNREG
jgi:hypothetical protein